MEIAVLEKIVQILLEVTDLVFRSANTKAGILKTLIHKDGFQDINTKCLLQCK